ncbi:MAG: hypothetical protein AAGE94_18880 [Acidobacteriota bacterium]
MTIDDRLLDQLGERARARDVDDIASESRRAADDALPSAEFKRRVVTEILRRQREDAEVDTGAETEQDDRAGDLDPPVVRPLAAPVHRPRPWLRSLAVAASVSLALGVAWWSRSPTSTNSASLPTFAVETLGVVAEVRGAPAPSATDDEISTGRYFVGNRVELRLRPEVPIEGPIRAVAWRQDGADWHRWPVDIAVSDQGAVRLRTMAGDPTLPIGEHTVRVDVSIEPDGGASDIQSWFWRLRVEPMTDGDEAP